MLTHFASKPSYAADGRPPPFDPLEPPELVLVAAELAWLRGNPPGDEAWPSVSPIPNVQHQLGALAVAPLMYRQNLRNRRMSLSNRDEVTHRLSESTLITATASENPFKISDCCTRKRGYVCDIQHPHCRFFDFPFSRGQLKQGEAAQRDVHESDVFSRSKQDQVVTFYWSG
jgi:hypothetical protein